MKHVVADSKPSAGSQNLLVGRVTPYGGPDRKLGERHFRRRVGPGTDSVRPASSRTARSSNDESSLPLLRERTKIRGRRCHARRRSSTRRPRARSSATRSKGIWPQLSPAIRKSRFAPRSLTSHWRSPATPFCVFSAPGWLSVTTSCTYSPNSSKEIGRSTLAKGWVGAQTVTSCVSHSQCRSIALLLISGTSEMVTASEQSPANTSASPPCMVVMRKLMAAAGDSRSRARRQSIRPLLGKYASTAIDSVGTPSDEIDFARFFISSVRAMTARASGMRLRPAAVSSALRASRSKSSRPSAVSNAEIAWLTADWARRRRRAAPVKLVSSHTAMKVRSWLIVTVSSMSSNL